MVIAQSEGHWYGACASSIMAVPSPCMPAVLDRVYPSQQAGCTLSSALALSGTVEHPCRQYMHAHSCSFVTFQGYMYVRWIN